jgi:DNA-binding NarL/FixJ family response regulator
MMPSNANRRAMDGLRNARERGPDITFEEMADKLHVSLAQMEQAIRREKARLQFTPREKQVIVSYARGVVGKDIAAELSLSVKTIQSHIHTMRRKFGGFTKYQVIQYCLVAGWLEVGDGLSEQAMESALAEKQKAEVD